MNYNKGDIIQGQHKDAYHPILFLKEKDCTFFYGIMLTKAGNYDENIPLPEQYIVKEKGGTKFLFQYNHTNFVNIKLLKKMEWQPFKKIGEVTTEGIKYIEENVTLDEARVWEEFLNKKIY